jgi:hypothetical protein
LGTFWKFGHMSKIFSIFLGTFSKLGHIPKIFCNFFGKFQKLFRAHFQNWFLCPKFFWKYFKFFGHIENWNFSQSFCSHFQNWGLCPKFSSIFCEIFKLFWARSQFGHMPKILVFFKFSKNVLTHFEN